LFFICFAVSERNVEKTDVLIFDSIIISSNVIDKLTLLKWFVIDVEFDIFQKDDVFIT